MNQCELIDGRSEVGARDRFFYYEDDALQAVRVGPWKLRLPGLKRLRDWPELDRGSQDAQLFHLGHDIGESNDRSREESALAASLDAAAMQWLDDLDAPRMKPNPKYESR